MYESFYNLVVPPFHNVPNSRFFFETEQHREALAKLEYTVRNRRGFALITGEVGSGKTTLTRTLLRRLGGDVRACLINNTRVSSEQLMKMGASECPWVQPGSMPASSQSVGARSTSSTSPCTRIPCGRRPGCEKIRGTCTRPS